MDRDVSRRGHTASITIPLGGDANASASRKPPSAHSSHRRPAHGGLRGRNTIVERVVIALAVLAIILFGLSRLRSHEEAQDVAPTTPVPLTIKELPLPTATTVETEQIALVPMETLEQAEDKLRAVPDVDGPPKIEHDRKVERHHPNLLPHMPAGPREIEERREQARQRMTLAAAQRLTLGVGDDKEVLEKFKRKNAEALAHLLNDEAPSIRPSGNLDHLFLHRPLNMSGKEFVAKLKESIDKMQAKLRDEAMLGDHEGLVQRIRMVEEALEHEVRLQRAEDNFNEVMAKKKKADEGAASAGTSEWDSNVGANKETQVQMDQSSVFEASLNLTEILTKRYEVIASFVGSHRKPRRLVLFTTLKPCYDASIRFAQLDAVRSWVSLPMASRSTAPYAHDPLSGQPFVASARGANETLKDTSLPSAGVRMSPPPPPVTVYLIVGGTDEMDAAQQKGLENVENKLDASMTEGQCSQWIADTINKDFDHMAYFRYGGQPQVRRGGADSVSRHAQGPVVVIPRAQAPRGKSGTVLFGSSIYKVTDLALKEEQRILFSEASGVLSRAIVDLWDQHRGQGIAKQQQNEQDHQTEAWTQQLEGQSPNGARGAPALHQAIRSDSKFQVSSGLKHRIQSAATAFAKSMPFTTQANRILFGFINGDILLDPQSSVALSRIQDVFKTVFIVGTRRSVKLKLKHRLSAVLAGAVKPPSSSGSLSGDKKEGNSEDAALKRRQPRLLDFSTAGWEMGHTFSSSTVDRPDAEDYFIWSGDFFSSHSALPNEAGAPPQPKAAGPLFAINHMAFIPDFHIGRPAFDNWFLNKALHTLLPVVDASGMLLAYHQVHDYKHLKKKDEGHGDAGEQQDESKKDESYWGRAESEENRELALANGGWQFGTLDFVPIQFGLPSSGLDKNDFDNAILPYCAMALRSQVKNTVSQSAPAYFVNDLGERATISSNGSTPVLSLYSAYQHLASYERPVVSDPDGVSKPNNVISLPYIGSFVSGQDPMTMSERELESFKAQAIEGDWRLKEDNAEEFGAADKDQRHPIDFGRPLQDADQGGHTFSSAFSPSQECQLHLRPSWGPFDDPFQGDRLRAWQTYYKGTHTFLRHSDGRTKALLALLGEADVVPVIGRGN